LVHRLERIDMKEVLGKHNQKLAVDDRMVKGGTYKNLSTVIFVPTLGMIPIEVVQSWMNLIKPMNQKIAGPIPLKGMEVGDAYEQMVTMLRANAELKKWKYVLTLEDDNIVPPDALMKLQEDIEAGPTFDAVGGLYWTKGEGGKPMCYGRTDVDPLDFVPWLPPQNVVAPCRGLGMGCTLFRMFRLLDEKFDGRRFKTVEQTEPGKGISMYTQDLRFFESAGKLRYRFAASTRVLVGHYDKESGITW